MDIKEYIFFNILGQARKYTHQPERGINIVLMKAYGDPFANLWPEPQKTETHEGDCE